MERKWNGEHEGGGKAVDIVVGGGGGDEGDGNNDAEAYEGSGVLIIPGRGGEFLKVLWPHPKILACAASLLCVDQ